jgi:hypothetical protein
MNGLVTCCVGAVFWDQLKERWKGAEGEEEDVSNHWILKEEIRF